MILLFLFPVFPYRFFEYRGHHPMPHISLSLGLRAQVTRHQPSMHAWMDATVGFDFLEESGESLSGTSKEQRREGGDESVLPANITLGWMVHTLGKRITSCRCLSSSPPAGSYAVSTLSASSGSLEEWDEEGRGDQDQTQVDASCTTLVFLIIHKVTMCVTLP